MVPAERLSCEIYVMNADGSNQTKLTSDLTTEQMSVWSPDDQKIAFASDGDGSPQLYVMNPVPTWRGPEGWSNRRETSQGDGSQQGPGASSTVAGPMA